MTTIAFKDGVMAGDRRVTSEDKGELMTCPEKARKVVRFRDGRLFGAAGNMSACIELRDATRKNLPTPKLANVEALLVHPDGVVWAYDDKRWIKVCGNCAALGSGAMGALAAMYVGADPVMAVRAACQFDPMSGGGVDVVRLKARPSN